MLAGARDHSGWSVQGLEFSAEAAGLGSALNKLDIVSSSVAGAPFPDGSFDYINVNNVLEHESDPVAALKRVSELLTAGGRVELTVPNGPVDLLPTVTLYRRGRTVKTRHDGHLFYFPRRTLERLLDTAGFRVVSLKNFHFKQGFKSRVARTPIEFLRSGCSRRKGKKGIAWKITTDRPGLIGCIMPDRLQAFTRGTDSAVISRSSPKEIGMPIRRNRLSIPYVRVPIGRLSGNTELSLNRRGIK